jgi:hypothetical protein
MNLQSGNKPTGAQRASGMKIHPLLAVLPPAQVGKDVFLSNLTGQRLNRCTGMLLLARKDDRLRP